MTHYKPAEAMSKGGLVTYVRRAGLLLPMMVTGTIQGRRKSYEVGGAVCNRMTSPNLAQRTKMSFSQYFLSWLMLLRLCIFN